MAAYSLPRGTTWSIILEIVSGGAPVNLLGHRVLATVRTVLVDGTTDTGYVWQGDSSGTGVVFSVPSSATRWSAGASIALNSAWMPLRENGYHYECTNAGSGTIGTTEPAWPIPSEWPLPAGAAPPSTAPDSNGVVWTLVGKTNELTITMPPSATQALANPVGGSTPLKYDVVDNDGAGGIWETEKGDINMTPRVTLSTP